MTTSEQKQKGKTMRATWLTGVEFMRRTGLPKSTLVRLTKLGQIITSPPTKVKGVRPRYSAKDVAKWKQAQSVPKRRCAKCKH